VLAHRQSSAWFSDTWHGWFEVPRPETQPGFDALTETPTTPTLEHNLLQFVTIDYGHIACRVCTTSDSGIDFTECDAVCELNDGGETCATRTL
jgi:hypothetical protein